MSNYCQGSLFGDDEISIHFPIFMHRLDGMTCTLAPCWHIELYSWIIGDDLDYTSTFQILRDFGCFDNWEGTKHPSSIHDNIWFHRRTYP